MASNREIFELIQKMDEKIDGIAQKVEGHEKLKNQLIGVWVAIASLGAVCSDYLKAKINLIMGG